jgi:recombination protein U
MINYPNAKNKTYTKQEDTRREKKVIYNAANRGMDFEHAINITCDFYRENNLAVISKRPTPIKIVKTDYDHLKITEAYFEKQSNTDYNGVYKAHYIDFECKETNSKTSLPFNNIPDHQISHLKKIIYHGGIAFFLIYFCVYDEIYLIDASIIIDKYENSGKKSIRYEDVKALGHYVEQGFLPRLKLLDVIDQVYFNEKNT